MKPNKVNKDVKAGELPVMKSFCKSCPFRPDEQGHWTDTKLCNTVIERTLLKGHQICHGTEGPNREWRNRCKGAFDHNSVIYERLGVPKETIDKYK